MNLLLYWRNRSSSAIKYEPPTLKDIKNGKRKQIKILNFCPDFAMRAFFFFFSARCSAARIFFSSSEPEATSSERYSSTAAQPASDLSAILMSLFLRLIAFEAELRESSSLRIKADTWGSRSFRGQPRTSVNPQRKDSA